jgi:hypothetical protein
MTFEIGATADRGLDVPILQTGGQRGLDEAVVAALKCGMEARSRGKQALADQLYALAQVIALCRQHPECGAEVQRAAREEGIPTDGKAKVPRLAARLVVENDAKTASHYARATERALDKGLDPAAFRTAYEAGKVTLEGLVAEAAEERRAKRPGSAPKLRAKPVILKLRIDDQFASEWHLILAAGIDDVAVRLRLEESGEFVAYAVAVDAANDPGEPKGGGQLTSEQAI